jgi:chromosome segregation ATPase|tara:strand:- start:552 stop:791 length:240 start_codon:yes stop_codon:yes gene_type:complete
MSKKKSCHGYDGILLTISEIERKINNLQEGISKIKSKMKSAEYTEEECVGELEADKAALEAIQGMCFEILLEKEPEGEA